MVDPVCVHCCDLGHVSLVSHSCSPAGYPHATEGLFLGPFHLCSLLTAVVWFVMFARDDVALRLAVWLFFPGFVFCVADTRHRAIPTDISDIMREHLMAGSKCTFFLRLVFLWAMVCRNLPLDRHIGICAQALRSFFVAFFSFPTIFLKASSRGHSIWTYTVRELTVNHRGHEDLMWKTLLMWKGNITGASQ